MKVWERIFFTHAEIQPYTVHLINIVNKSSQNITKNHNPFETIVDCVVMS